MKKIKIIFILLFILSFSQNNFAQRDDSLYYGLRVFSNVINHIKTNYVEEVKSLDLIGGALYGMLRSLDPHTVYLNPRRFQEFNSIMNGEAAGLGLEMDIIDDMPVVVSIAPYSPAYSSGIKPGDVLLAVNDSLTKGLSYQELEILLHGKDGEEVKLKMQSGITEKEYIEELEFDTFEALSIPFAFVIDEKIGYLKCAEFRGTTAEELEDALDDFQSQHISSLIIDLRGNPGGSADAMENMADLFLTKGRIISTTEGRKKEMFDTVRAKEDEYLRFPIKLVLLIDRGSASASEAFTGALQDNDRAVVVGTNSFGKGLIMRTFLLDNGAAILMTVGKYKTPAGRVVQREYKDKKFVDYKKDIYDTDSTNIKNRPTFTSVGGRTLYGGGGIVPDIFVENYDRILHDLSVDENLFYKYASKEIADKSFMDNKNIKIEDVKGLAIDSVYMNEALSAVKGKDESQIPALKKIIEAKIKRHMAGILFGEASAFQLELEYDDQVQAAINAFYNYSEILKTQD